MQNDSDIRRERTVGMVLLVLGLALAGGTLIKIQREPLALAQSESQPAAPAESTPGGTRPTTPAPEPARPQVQPGETTGSAPAADQDRPPELGKPLPPAPAEKIGPPIERK
jgi:hypothetical protein